MAKKMRFRAMVEVGRNSIEKKGRRLNDTLPIYKVTT